MLISIIVPVYKVEQYIERCVDSILNQTYRQLEVILVDDCSPDHSMEIAEMYIQMNKAETALLSLSAFCIYPKRKRHGFFRDAKEHFFFRLKLTDDQSSHQP